MKPITDDKKHCFKHASTHRVDEQCPYCRAEVLERNALDAVADEVLAYRAPARTTKARKRQRLRRKTQRESSI